MVDSKGITRRQLASVAALAPLAQITGQVTVLQARPFPLKQVRLLDGICFYLMERDRGYLHALDSGRLLHTFRLNAGLASSAEQLGGWERPDIELRGHFTGHYLSACALMYGSARDELLKAKAERMVAELGKCQKALGGEYLSAFPSDFLERLKERLPVWAPWYTLHKIMAGMLEMHIQCGSAQALDILEGMARWTKKWADPLNDAEMARLLEVEYGGMNDVLYHLYSITGKNDYLNLGHRFDHERVFGPLAEGRDELKGLHVNTQIPKIIGAARRYELTGEARYRRIAEFFWSQVVEHRSYCTGGVSNFERWRTEPENLATELSANTQECCCTYNMLKLTRQLFSWKPEASYADYYERAFFNGILGTMNPKDGMTMYYVPLESGYFKVFSLPLSSFWCCTGSGTESFAKLSDSIFFHDDSTLYVNQFIPSRLEWPEKKLFVRQETGFPEQEGTKLIFQSQSSTRLAVKVRVPYWADKGVSAKVNGAPVAAAAKASYLTLERDWKAGDTLEISLPMRLHSQPLPGDPTMQALMYGPLVLAGELGTQGLSRDMQYGDPFNARGGKFLRGDPVPAPELLANGESIEEWVKPVGGQPLTFRTTGQRQNITLSPLNRLFEQRYGVYFRVRKNA